MQDCGLLTDQQYKDFLNVCQEKFLTAEVLFQNFMTNPELSYPIFDYQDKAESTSAFLCGQSVNQTLKKWPPVTTRYSIAKTFAEFIEFLKSLKYSLPVIILQVIARVMNVRFHLYITTEI